MLQLIRDKAQSWIAIAIVGLLILGLSTVAWDAYFSPDPEVPVAKVNGAKITSNEFQRAYGQQRARLQQMLGGADISQFIPDEVEFKKNILKRLEEEELIFQAAVASGYRVSDALLAQQIRNFETFQSDGQFNSELYEQWLRQSYMSAGEFEEMLRRDVLVQQYRLAIGATSWTTEQERNALLKLQEQKRDVGFVTIAATSFLDKISVSDEEAQAHYDDNSIKFSTQERVSIEYLDLTMSELTKDVDVDDAKLGEIYQERQSEFGIPEERRTRHIMIEVAGDASEEQLNSAREKAEALLTQLGEGASFAELARQNSDDIGTANDGGDLGFMSHDAMIDPAYADAAFALEKGAVSDVVKSGYGFHIIKLEGINAGQVKTFAEVKAELEQEYRRHQAEDKFFEQGEILANMTFENPDTLEIAADELGLKVVSSELFSRDAGTGIAMDERIRSAAFSDEVLQQGLNSQPLELADDRVLVLRIKDHQQSSVRPFAEVKAEIVTTLRQQAAEKMAEQEGLAILELLADNNKLEVIAAERKLNWGHPEPIKRNSTIAAADVVQKAFRMATPEEAKTAAHAGLRMSTGDYAVIALFDVLEADIESVEPATSQSIKDQRQRYYGASELLGAMADMRQAAEIKEYPENF